MAKEPAHRYATAGELADDLQRSLRGEPIQARPVKVWRRWTRRARARPAITALLALVALVTTLGFGGVLWQWRQAVTARLAAAANARAEAEAREQLEVNLYAPPHRPGRARAGGEQHRAGRGAAQRVHARLARLGVVLPQAAPPRRHPRPPRPDRAGLRGDLQPRRPPARLRRRRRDRQALGRGDRRPDPDPEGAQRLGPQRRLQPRRPARRLRRGRRVVKLWEADTGDKRPGRSGHTGIGLRRRLQPRRPARRLRRRRRRRASSGTSGPAARSRP